MIESPVAVESAVRFRDRLRAHVSIARPDHLIKNVFVLPGIAIPLISQPELLTTELAVRIAIGLIAVCFIASSNYVLNEILDAGTDRFHPTKQFRPIPRGLVRLPVAYGQWLVFMLFGLALALLISKSFAVTAGALWIMGCVYNVPPFRTKDLVYLDVLTESVNNPLRLLLGWFMVPTLTSPPLSLLISYWMVGCYFMALKRFSEYREIGNVDAASAYRKSFERYDERALLVSTLFYASTAMLFFGAFVFRYRVELILSFPFIAVVMACYFYLSFEPNSPVQHPERLHRSRLLMTSVVMCAISMIVLMAVRLAWIHDLFMPTMPVSQ